MKLDERRDRWIISFSDGRIQLIQIDFRLSFLIVDGPSKAWIHIETRGKLKCEATESSFVPERSETLAPMLALFNAAVNKIEIGKTGELVVSTERDHLILVAPDAKYESWQISCSIGSDNVMFVCPPGGEVAFFHELETRQGVAQVIDRMRSAKRPELLMLLATSIAEMTILGRGHYDDEDSSGRLRSTNEAIHRLAGHLRDLCDPDEAFTESRAAGIGGQLALLHPSAVARIYASR